MAVIAWALNHHWFGGDAGEDGSATLLSDSGTHGDSGQGSGSLNDGATTSESSGGGDSSGDSGGSSE